jgi:hypothetical protein
MTAVYLFCFYFQHAAHLEALLEESRSLSTKKLHDSGVRTICISETGTVDLDKVEFQILFMMLL